MPERAPLPPKLKLAFGPSSSQLPERLLAAAREELATTGAANLSVRAVARRVNVSHQATVHHFRDRTGLLTALAVIGFNELGSALEVAIGDTSRSIDPADLRRIVGEIGVAYTRYAAAQPALFGLMFDDALIDPQDPSLQLARLAVWNRLLNAVIDLSRTGQATAIAPERLALFAWSSVHGLAVIGGGPLHNYLDSARIDEIVRSIADSIRIS